MAKKSLISKVLGVGKSKPEKTELQKKASKAKKAELQDKAIEIEINKEERAKKRKPAKTIKVEFIKSITGIAVGTVKNLDSKTANSLVKIGSVKIIE